MPWCVHATVNPPWYVNVIFDGAAPGEELVERGREPVPLNQGLPVASDHPGLVSGGWTEKPRKRMPDVIERWEFLMVSNPVRDAIERLEPGAHQFFPFDLRNGKRGASTPQPYHLLNVLQTAEGIDVARSPVDLRHGAIWPSRSGEYGFRLSAREVGNRHLWRDPRFHLGFFVSDPLHAALGAIGARGLDMSECVEVNDSVDVNDPSEAP